MPFNLTDNLKQPTLQTEPIPGREAEMSRNAAGGFAFDIDDWARLNRFLILGSEAGTYYTDARKLTVDNAQVVERCVKADGIRTVDAIVNVSDKGLAPKNDAAILALAIAAKKGDDQTRAYALGNLQVVCRIGTHLFQFAEAVELLGGWGRGTRNAVGHWYTDKPVDDLAYQVVKYQKRNGWSHKDLWRLAHPKIEHPGVVSFVMGKAGYSGVRVIEGHRLVHGAPTAKFAAATITEFRLPRESVPTPYLNDPTVQEALLMHMGVTAMIRNLGNMSKSGLLTPFSDGTKFVVDRLSDKEWLKKGRVHPMAIFLAQCQYATGRGLRGSGNWAAVQQIVTALDDAFYGTMDNVTPTNKNVIVTVDTSGSMMPGYSHSLGLGNLSEVEAAAVMALVVARTEPSHLILFCGTSCGPLPIHDHMTIDQARKTALAHPGGGTDLSLPYQFAMQNGLDNADAFVTLTDNETWAGQRGHPAQQLDAYRKAAPSEVRNVNVAFTATRHMVADPADPLTLQCVGLDASLPVIVNRFIAGEV